MEYFLSFVFANEVYGETIGNAGLGKGVKLQLRANFERERHTRLFFPIRYLKVKHGYNFA